jgi:hypothetical protein
MRECGAFHSCALACLLALSLCHSLCLMVPQVLQRSITIMRDARWQVSPTPASRQEQRMRQRTMQSRVPIQMMDAVAAHKCHHLLRCCGRLLLIRLLHIDLQTLGSASNPRPPRRSNCHWHCAAAGIVLRVRAVRAHKMMFTIGQYERRHKSVPEHHSMDRSTRPNTLRALARLCV